MSEPIQAAGSTTSIQDGTGEKSVPEQMTDALRYRLISEEFNLIYKKDRCVKVLSHLKIVKFDLQKSWYWEKICPMADERRVNVGYLCLKLCFYYLKIFKRF